MTRRSPYPNRLSIAEAPVESAFDYDTPYGPRNLRSPQRLIWASAQLHVSIVVHLHGVVLQSYPDIHRDVFERLEESKSKDADYLTYRSTDFWS